MYDITNAESLSRLRDFFNFFKNFEKKSKKLKILVGTKADEDLRRKVSRGEAETFVENYGLSHIEISSKFKSDLIEVFSMIFQGRHGKRTGSGKEGSSGGVGNLVANSRGSGGSNKDTIKPQHINNYSEMFLSDPLKAKQVKHEHVFKLILLGDSAVGKTSFFKKYFQKLFDYNFMSTVGIVDDYKKIKINSTVIKLQLWDTAGQEQFRSLPRRYYSNADGILLLFDLTNERSFENISGWVKDINTHSKEGLTIFLLGTKCDLVSERKIAFDTALDMAFEHKIKYVEVSAKEDINITDVIAKISNRIYKKGFNDENQSILIKKEKKAKQQNKKKCCE